MRGEIGLYTDPAVYDILHTPGTAEEVDGLERIARRWGRAPRGRSLVWMEPACGTGRYLRLAARRGHRALGIDRSAPLISYARGVARAMGVSRRTDLRVGDMTRLPGAWRGKVDLAFCLINSIRHLASDGAMLRHLRSVAGALRPGGVYCVGITLTSYGMEYPSEDVWEGRRGGCRVKQVIQFVPPLDARAERARAERAFSHLIVTRGDRVEHRDSAYVLRTYSRVQWESLVRRSPLRVRATVDEVGAPVTLTPSGYAVWVLERA